MAISSPQALREATCISNLNGTRVARCSTRVGVAQDGIWQHYAITYDSQAIRIYVNGIQGTVCTATGSAGADASPVSIGGTNAASATGIMEEIRIYNRALSALEITDVYN